MRILFLTTRQLDQPRTGGEIKSAALLSYLERRREVDVAAFVRPGTRWERSAGRTVTLPLDRPRSVGRLVASYVHRVPLSVERNRHAEMAAAVRDLVEVRAHDVVLVDGWLMAQYLPSDFPGRKLLHQHNAEHLMWRRQAALESSPFRRTLVAVEAARVERYERALLRRFDVVFAVSEPDREALLRLGGPPPLPILPNVPDPSLLARVPLRPHADPVLLHLGTLSWPPNVEGLLRFLHDGFPALRREVPEARLVLAGAGAPSRLVALARRTAGVEIMGPVADDEPLYRGARCFVDVGLGGAGTRVKILNALARGLPVVATRDAADGLDAGAREALLVAEHPGAAVPPLLELLSNDETWRRLSERGRSVISARYRPDLAFASLDAALEDEG